MANGGRPTSISHPFDSMMTHCSDPREALELLRAAGADERLAILRSSAYGPGCAFAQAAGRHLHPGTGR